MTAQIKIKDLRKDFGKLEVLKGINLEINKGQVVCVTAVYQPVGGTHRRRNHR